MRHEIHLTATGLKAALPAAGAVVAVAAVLGGGRGAGSAALGAGLVVANQLTAAASTGWSRVMTANVLAVGYAMFVVRMFAMFAAFAVLSTVGWIVAPTLAIAFCSVLVVTLTTECIAYARGTYVPQWRTAR